jgi:hypothetical protein
MNVIHNHILVGVCLLLYQKKPLIPSILSSLDAKRKVCEYLVKMKNI